MGAASAPAPTCGAPRIIAFVGSARPAKAHLLANTVCDTLASGFGLRAERRDLSDAGTGLLTLDHGALDKRSRALVKAIEQCDGLVVGMPVYQGSYPGLFKHVFDLIHPEALRNKPVLLTAVGGGLRHSLMVEHQLRPLFGFFEASTVSTAIYACAEEIAPGEMPTGLLAARIANAAAQFASLVLRPTARTKP
jgi:FMN reductase